jgi:putative hydrolase of the HAD superfamily
MMITHLLFDFFGTLVTYTPGHFGHEPYEHTYRFLIEHGFTIPYDDFVQQFSDAFQEHEQSANQTLLEFHMHDVGLTFFYNTFQVQVDQTFLAAFIEKYIQEWNRGVAHFSDIEPIIKQAAQSFTLGIISNTHYPQLIHRNLEAMNIAQYFAVIVTSVEHGHRKPHPSIFQDTLTQLNIGPPQVLYIGDNYNDDYIGAKNAGLQCILIDPKQQHIKTARDRVDTLYDVFAKL